MAGFENSILLPTHAMECPFCGGTDAQLVNCDAKYFVRCKACDAHGPLGNTAEEALKHWNWTGHMAE